MMPKERISVAKRVVKSTIESAAFINAEAHEFDPTSWSETPALLTNANCYAYAVNHRGSKEKLQPGQLAGVPMDGSLLPVDSGFFSVTVRATCDGLIQTGDVIEQKPGHYAVALFLSHKHECYHWARQNPDGTWSHKFPGYEPELICDDFGRPLRDLRGSKIQFWPDTPELNISYEFSGYFNVPSCGLKEKPAPANTARSPEASFSHKNRSEP